MLFVDGEGTVAEGRLFAFGQLAPLLSENPRGIVVREALAFFKENGAAMLRPEQKAVYRTGGMRRGFGFLHKNNMLVELCPGHKPISAVSGSTGWLTRALKSIEHANHALLLPSTLLNVYKKMNNNIN